MMRKFVLAACLLLLCASTVQGAVLFEDHFSGDSLSRPPWSVLRETFPRIPDFGVSGGFLHTKTLEGHFAFNDNNAKNFIRIANAWGSQDFALTIRVSSFNPTDSVQQITLMAYDGDDDYIQVVNYRGGAGTRYWAFVKEVGVQRWYEESGLNANNSAFYLRIVKQGTSYTGSYSLDAVTYNQIGSSYTFGDGSPAYLGLCAYQGTHSTPPTPVEVQIDFFRVETLPTAIKLVSFEAIPSLHKIILTWKTATETDNAGFHLWRAEAGTENYVQITESLIPGEGTDISGASYEYTDADVTAGKSYSYKLEDIDLNGTSTFHGPVTATAGDLTPLTPKDGTTFSTRSAPQFGWTAYPFDRFRLQFCTLDDFSGKVVELPLATKSRTAWLTSESYTPTDKEWAAVKSLAGKKGGVIWWRVVGAYGLEGSGVSSALSFRLPPG